MSNAAFTGSPYEPDPAQAPSTPKLIQTKQSYGGTALWRIKDYPVRISRITVYSPNPGTATVYLWPDYLNPALPNALNIVTGTQIGEMDEWSDPLNPLEVPAGGGIGIAWDGPAATNGYARFEYVEIL